MGYIDTGCIVPDRTAWTQASGIRLPHTPQHVLFVGRNWHYIGSVLVESNYQRTGFIFKP